MLPRPKEDLMLDSAYQDVPESPEERMERRRTRRWKRRARIAGPFLGVTMMLGALTLSVDLIEYQPQEPQQRLTDRPIRDSSNRSLSNWPILSAASEIWARSSPTCSEPPSASS